MTTSCDPADNRRHPGSGPGGVKWATGHNTAGNRVGCAKWDTGTQNTNKISLRRNYKYGTWNVQGLIQHPGKLQIIEREMETYNICILGLAETHWRGEGFFRSGAGNVIYFSGPERESRKGVALIVSPKIQKAIRGYKAVNDRILHLRLQGTGCLLNVVQVYAPTSTADEEDMDKFYGNLEETLRNIPSGEICIILGDYNAKIGSTQKEEHLRHIVGKFGLGERNERGERLLDFCTQQHFAIMNTFFQHHPRRLNTWRSPGDRARNQIDYILINERWKTSVKNVKVYPGAECGSDHQLLIAKVRISLKSIHKSTPKPRALLGNALQTFRERIEKALLPLTANKQRKDARPKILWMGFKDKVQDTANQCYQAVAERRKPLISEETWQVIKGRKKVKAIRENEQEYRKLNREVQRRCRTDKEKYICNICQEIEDHYVRNEAHDLHQKVRLSQEFKPRSSSIENDKEEMVHDMEQILQVWRNYFAQLYTDN